MKHARPAVGRPALSTPRPQPLASRPPHAAHPRRVFVLSAALLISGVQGLWGAPATYLQMIRAKRAGKPNLILIVADGLGYGDLGCYGQQRIRTRHLDRLAGEGIRFTQWYAGSPDRVASRACLLTGRPAAPAGPETTRSPTIATVLQDAGYKTCGLGIWDLGRPGSSSTPNRQGFDEWLGALDPRSAHDYYPASLWRNDRRHDLSPNRGGAAPEYAPDLYTRAAINFMRANVKFPFFLYLATPLPGANPQLTSLTGNGMQVPTPHAYSDREWPEPERDKAAMITHLDETVGQILAALDQLELSRDTLIAVTSSAGPYAEGGVDPSFFSSSGPLRGQGGDLYEGGLRVPFIARWPTRVPAGKVQDQPGAHWDFFSTAAELALTNAPPTVAGRSVLPALLEQPLSNRNEVLYWENLEPNQGQAVREGDWKGVRSAPGAPLELFNLQTDPRERYDVAAEHSPVVSRLEDRLRGLPTSPPPGALESAPTPRE